MENIEKWLYMYFPLILFSNGFKVDYILQFFFY